MTGGPAMAAGGIGAGAPARILVLAPSGPSSLLSARAAAFGFRLEAVADDKRVNLTWSPSAPEKGGLAIYDGEKPDIGEAASVGPATGKSAQVGHLINGTTYYFWLVADSNGPNVADGKGQNVVSNVVSNMVSATPAAMPGAPTGLTVTPGNSQVTLSWTAPEAGGGSPITGYIITQGTSPGHETGTPVNGTPVTATSTTVTGLVNGTTYYFKVTAINRVGEGPAAEAEAVPVTVPGAPTGLTVTPGDSQVTLSWTAPEPGGGSPITGYHIYAGTTADFSGRTPIATVKGTVVRVTGLANGTTYYFKVTAINRVGEGPAAEAEAVPVAVPGAPTGLTVTPGDSQVTLSWAAPALDGGSPISDYIIYQGTSPGGETGAPVNGSPVTATSTTVTGLVNGTTYYFRVVAVNAAGQSPLSAEASATLLPITPSSPSPSSATTPSRTTTAPSTTTPSSATTAPSTTTPPSATTAPSTTTPPSATTAPSTTSASSAGPGPASTSAPAFAAPTVLTATAGNTQVRLSWAAPVSDGGSPVSGYKVYLATVPSVQESAAIGSTRDSGITVIGLANGTVYYFMVTAVNAAGNESPSSTAVSAEPTGPVRGATVSLNSPTVPKQLIGLLTAVAAVAAAGAFTLIARRRRPFRSRDLDHSARGQARSSQQMAVPSDLRAVPDTARPDVVSVRDTGREPTYTIRLEPHTGVATTTIKEERP